MLRKFLHHRDGGCGKVCCTKIEDFGVSFGNFTVFADVNLHIHCGELTAVIGANGAGKSTLFKAVLGEIPHKGKLRYMDATGRRTDCPIIGYVPQQLLFDRESPVSVEDIFAASLSRAPSWLYRPNSLIERIRRDLERTKAADLMNRRLGALSGGELQRVLLALALDPMPNLLLLDEPVSGVDRPGLDLFYETVSALRENEDLAIILISHDLKTVKKYADRVVLLNHGRAISGAPDEILAAESIESLFS